ncbi:hypothetical protein HHI36_002298 [Cryptolaemus montrouzieri]|uniref:Uncharacterized protein n=1 Tax=Cryptolaemus montrouzieri TaxID=559131 RepID=A0ABD2PBJ0_9CUCU
MGISYTETTESVTLTPTKKRKLPERVQKYKPEWEKQYVWIVEDPEAHKMFNVSHIKQHGKKVIN